MAKVIVIIDTIRHARLLPSKCNGAIRAMPIKVSPDITPDVDLSVDCFCSGVFIIFDFLFIYSAGLIRVVI